MLSPINVLVIEDDPFWQKIIRTSLAAWGCTVSGCVTNADDAISILDETDFDIALVDIYLGGKTSGLMLGKLIRQKFDRPFIFLTAVVDPKLFSAVISANSSSYLTKPFSPESLFISINSAIQQFNNIPAEFNSFAHQELISPFFFVKNGKQLKRIDWRDVVCLRSDGNYTKVITKNNELYMIRSSLQKALSIIIPAGIRYNFVQVNRAEVLQVRFIEELINNEVTIDSQVFLVTESYMKNLKQRLNVIL